LRQDGLQASGAQTTLVLRLHKSSRSSDQGRSRASA
jgi:hypothetical protein